MASLAAEGIREQKLGLAKHLRKVPAAAAGPAAAARR
jgi:hypothetical protein